MNFKVIGCLTLLVSGYAYADGTFMNTDGAFVTVSTSTSTFGLKKGSLQVEGQTAVAVESEASNTGTDYYKVSVKQSDCKAGYGYLYTNGFNGTFIRQTPAVHDGDNVASWEFDVLCKSGFGV